MTYSFYTQACRFYNITRFFYALAARCNLEIDIKKDGLFMIDYFVTIRGSAESIKSFRNYVMKLLNELTKWIEAKDAKRIPNNDDILHCWTCLC